MANFISEFPIYTYESLSSSTTTDEQQRIVIANWVKFSCDKVVLKCMFMTYLKDEGKTPSIMVYTGRLRPKGAPYSGFSYIKG